MQEMRVPLVGRAASGGAPALPRLVEVPAGMPRLSERAV